MVARVLVSVLAVFCLATGSLALTLSSKLIHRFSDEALAVRVSRSGGRALQWPRRRSMEYFELLRRSDLQRQRMRLRARYPSLFPSEGGETFFPGSDMGWLHYTWINIGTPNVSFFVALDTGSDLSWVPCDCVQCAPLSDSYYNMDRDLGVYSPSKSSTSKHLSCSHQLCDLGPDCKNPKQPCPYHVDYASDNTSTSGLLVEDILYLSSNSRQSTATIVKTPVIIGCGRTQSGGYLNGVAPDGLLGLGLSDISVPSFLAKAGLIQDSFSLCFKKDDSGRIIFGDEGLPSQHSTPFLTLEGKYLTYAVGVESFCVGSACLEQTAFTALVDSGSSFTHLPNGVYEKVTMEFDRQITASKISFDDPVLGYCYNSSSLDLSKVPALAISFTGNNSLVVRDPFLPLVLMKEETDVFCLALQPTPDDIGTIGQDSMRGYRMVFDRESLKLRWSRSSCHDTNAGTGSPTPPRNRPENPLPTNEQQNSSGGRAVSPVEAGRTRTPANKASAVVSIFGSQFCSPRLLLLCIWLALATALA